MTIYIDIVFLINFLMDLTIIWAAGMLVKEKIRILRLILGAAFGAAAYILILCLEYSNTLLQLPTGMFAMALSLVIAYTPKNIFHLLKLMIISVITAFIIAGIMFAMLMMKMVYGRLGTGYILSGFNIGLLIITSLAVYIAIKLFGKAIRKNAADKREFFDITVELGGKSFTARALADTGNSLKDFSGNSDVIVCQYSVMKGILPEGFVLTDALNMFSALSKTSLGTRVSLIPYKSLGNAEGMLLGIRCDSATITGNGRKTQLDKPIICIYDGVLDGSGLFNAITNYDVFI